MSPTILVKIPGFKKKKMCKKVHINPMHLGKVNSDKGFAQQSEEAGRLIWEAQDVATPRKALSNDNIHEPTKRGKPGIQISRGGLQHSQQAAKLNDILHCPSRVGEHSLASVTSDLVIFITFDQWNMSKRGCHFWAEASLPSVWKEASVITVRAKVEPRSRVHRKEEKETF